VGTRLERAYAANSQAGCSPLRKARAILATGSGSGQAPAGAAARRRRVAARRRSRLPSPLVAAHALAFDTPAQAALCVLHRVAALTPQERQQGAEVIFEKKTRTCADRCLREGVSRAPKVPWQAAAASAACRRLPPRLAAGAGQAPG
jgi:hypothetical protein